MAKVLCISGSPRGANSSSEKMLMQLIGHIRDYGGEVEFIRLVEKKIIQCEGCYSQTQSGEKCTFPCIHLGKDDTMEILNKVIECDALAISTPVYWGSASALVHQLIEKMCSLENNTYEISEMTGKRPALGKPAVILTSQAIDGSALVVSQLMWALTHIGFMMLPCAGIFKPAILNRKIVQLGLKMIKYNKWEWIDNCIRLAARNLIEVSNRLRDFNFDDNLVKEPRC